MASPPAPQCCCAPLLAGLVPGGGLQQVLLELALVVWQRAPQRAARAVQPVTRRADALQPAHCGEVCGGCRWACSGCV